MKITFCGAAREVTGSCYLIEVEGVRFLVDCGLFQGGDFCTDRNYDPFLFDPGTIDFVLLTHAHQDHCGRIPRLNKFGFKGKIYATAATCDLASVVLFDSAKLISEEAERNQVPPLYEDSDVRAILPHFKPVFYGKKFKPHEKIEVCFQEAGHILGSAIIELFIAGKKIVFSGDLGFEPVLLIKPRAKIEDADIVVCESTYGNRLHQKEDKLKVVEEAVEDIERKKAVLIIPAFALERTQELLFELNNLIEKREVEVLDVFIDSPLAIKITEIFDKHKSYYNLETQKQLKSDKIFRFPGLKLTETVSQSKYINTSPKPKIVIAGSGMCNGGRILHHFKHNITGNDNIVLIVGFQVKGTLGSRLVEGVKNIKIFHRELPVKAQIRKTEAFSGHADQTQLIEWLENFQKQRLKKIFLTHGDQEAIFDFSKKIKDKLKAEVQVPGFGDEVLL